MQWHKGGPDAPLSSCWPLPLFQSLRKGLEVEKVLGTGHIAALITHSVTIEPNVCPPPSLGLTPSWQAGKVMGPLWLVCQQSAKTAPPCPLPQPCSRWLTAAKCFSPASLCTGIPCREAETEIMGGVRRWVTGGTLHPIKGFLCWLSCANKEAFLERHLSESSASDILSATRDCNWLRRHRKKKEIVHRQDIPPG